jgi:hypothetical protein
VARVVRGPASTTITDREGLLAIHGEGRHELPQELKFGFAAGVLLAHGGIRAPQVVAVPVREGAEVVLGLGHLLTAFRVTCWDSSGERIHMEMVTCFDFRSRFTVIMRSRILAARSRFLAAT